MTEYGHDISSISVTTSLPVKRSTLWSYLRVQTLIKRLILFGRGSVNFDSEVVLFYKRTELKFYVVHDATPEQFSTQEKGFQPQSITNFWITGQTIRKPLGGNKKKAVISARSKLFALSSEEKQLISS